MARSACKRVIHSNRGEGENTSIALQRGGVDSCVSQVGRDMERCGC